MAMHTDQPCRVLAIVAHPDDAEIAAGDCWCDTVVWVSAVALCRQPTDRATSCDRARATDRIRREESRRAGAMIHADNVTLDFPDGYLQPDLTLLAAIIEEIRRFGPDLVLTPSTQ